MRGTKQLYFEHDRVAQARSLEEATNVKTVVETMLHNFVCLSTAGDVVREYIQSVKYQVFKARAGDDPSVVALVVSSAPPIAHAELSSFVSFPTHTHLLQQTTMPSSAKI